MASARRWQPERPEIRASDAERERVVAFLRDKAAEGRLTADELDERVGHAYAAVTRGDLDRLLTDLPDPPVRTRSARSPRPGVQRGLPARRGLGLVLLAMAALTAMRLPALVLVLVWAGFAVAVTLVALVAALAVAASPVIALVVLAVVMLRRRNARSWRAPGYR